MSFNLKRIFLIFGLVLSLFLVAPSPAYADPGWWDDIQVRFSGMWSALAEQFATNVASWTINIAASGLDTIIGTGFGVNSQTIGSIPSPEALPHNGLLAITGGLADSVYNSPPDVLLATYLQKELGNNLLSSPTYAQTIGEASIHPVFAMWEKVRNIAYASFVIVIAAIALMIILRKQLDTRMVVTVAHALPRMFVALILVTLSYPIIALFVDLFIVWLPAVIGDLAFDPLEQLAGIVTTEGVSGAVTVFGEYSLRLAIGGLRFLTAGTAAHILTGGLSTLALVALVALFVIVAILVLGFVALQLIYRYARILVLTVFSPLILLIGALPGQEGTITSWFKDLAVQTLFFPAILLLCYISATLLVDVAAPSTEGIRRLFAESSILGTLSFASEVFILPVASLIILLMSFKIPGIIENAIKGGKGRR